MKKILILGGSGFIGEALANALCDENIVKCFDLNLPKKKNSKVHYIQANFFNDLPKLKQSLKGINTVIHCISTTVPATSKTVRFEHDTNVHGIIRLLDLMVKEKVPYLCYLSSGGTIYGDSNTLHTEEEALYPGCPYGLGKLLIENIINYYHQRRLVNAQIWRLSNPYGNLNKTNKTQGVIEAFVNNILNDKPLEIWGDGTAIRDYIYIDDVTSAMKELLRVNFWGETTNISTGLGVSVKSIVEFLQRSVPKFYDKEIEVRTVGKFTGPKVAVISPQKLRDNTLWKPKYSIAQGIEKMLENYNA